MAILQLDGHFKNSLQVGLYSFASFRPRFCQLFLKHGVSVLVELMLYNEMFNATTLLCNVWGLGLNSEFHTKFFVYSTSSIFAFSAMKID